MSLLNDLDNLIKATEEVVLPPEPVPEAEEDSPSEEST